MFVDVLIVPPPQVAEEVESQLQKYKAAVDEINSKTGGDHDGDTNGEPGGSVHPGDAWTMTCMQMVAYLQHPARI